MEQQQRVESTIERVTVFHQGATVRRVVDLAADESGELPAQIELVGLPLALFDPTVRVRVGAVHGEPGARVIATDVRVELFAPPRVTVDASADERAVRELGRELGRKRSLIEQIHEEVALLERMPVPERPEPEEGKAPVPAPLAARLALEQFRADTIAARRAELRALRDETTALGEQLAAAERRVEQASSARRVAPHELSKAVVVRLRRDGGARVARARVLVEYFVPGARWAPAYECRMARDGRAAELVLRALVAQRSGEDWRGARLSLSTAAPMSWTELPVLSALRLGRAQDAPAVPPPRPPPAGAEVLFADFDRDRAHAAALLPAPPPPPQLEAQAHRAESIAFGGGSGGAAASAGDAMTVAARPAKPRPAAAARKEKKGGAKRARDEGESDDYLDAVPAAEERVSPMEPMRAMASMALAAPAPPPPPASRGRRAASQPAPAEEALDLDASLATYQRTSEAEKSDAAPTRAEVVLYNHLRLAAPDDGSHRNRLRPVDVFAAYRERLVRRGLDGLEDLDLASVVRDAAASAWQTAAKPLPAGAGDVRALSGHFDYAYETEAVVDVPSDGVFHSVPVGRRSCPADVLYLVVPREEPQVYRQATITNPLAAPLLAGPADVYVGGEFVLSTILPTVAARGEFRLGLGVEQAVRCARNAAFTERRSGTRAVATNELRHEVTIELANNLDREIACEVRERIPQPAQGAEVDVEEARVEPAWEKYDQAERGAPIEGGRRWRVKVAAGKTATLRAEYVVKVYANNEIVGGNRREA